MGKGNGAWPGALSATIFTPPTTDTPALPLSHPTQSVVLTPLRFMLRELLFRKRAKKETGNESYDSRPVKFVPDGENSRRVVWADKEVKWPAARYVLHAPSVGNLNPRCAMVV